ncbi:hypothetical protein HDU78_010315 [Chytriomyces hyalinus]|nr:hypothetical protein HDU78_010315 [Chytriomyces hyalinus]KAJ3245070.1 hypothetical protein HDU77_009596 [Chytriomyces hyalinus]
MLVPVALIAFLASVSHASIRRAMMQRACQPNVLVDDFRPRTPSMYRQQPLQIVQGGVSVPVIVSFDFSLAAHSLLTGSIMCFHSTRLVFSAIFHTHSDKWQTYCDQGLGFNGCNKTLNLLGGDYGDSGAAEVMTEGRLTLTAQDLNAINAHLEDAARPNSSETIN